MISPRSIKTHSPDASPSTLNMEYLVSFKRSLRLFTKARACLVESALAIIIWSKRELVEVILITTISSDFIACSSSTARSLRF